MSHFDLTPSPAPTSASPIADLSYRNFDGPLQTRAARWWIVAVANIRITRRKPGFWILTLLAMLPYIMNVILLYLSSGGFSPVSSKNPDEKYAVHFYQALQSQQFWLFLLALLVGASCIAADNRANALLVYLSKPITKGDYLLGKWMGIFLILFGIGAVPSLLLYVYCMLSYWGEGFSTHAVKLIGQILLANEIPAAVHASLLVAFSAWSKTPRMAGAIYAGFYLISGVVVGIIGRLEFKSHADARHLVQSLSVPGAISGLAQNVYHVTLQVPKFHRATQELLSQEIPPPLLGPMLGIVIGLIVVGVVVARMKINAVEVVRG